MFGVAALAAATSAPRARKVRVPVDVW